MGVYGKPPLWSVFAVQMVSVAGDQIGQRASRKDFHHSSRRMLLSLTFISGTQILLCLGFLQLVLNSSVTGAIYSHGDTLPCYQEIDMEGHKPSYCDTRNCTKIDCPSQGPGSMFRSFRLHPLLWANGIQNVAYYIGEVLLYHHPLGLVFIVIAALSASFIINPLEGVVGLAESDPVPAAVIIFGLIGSVLCVLERKEGEELTIAQMYRRTWRRLSHLAHRLCSHPSERECDDCRRTVEEIDQFDTVADVTHQPTPTGTGTDESAMDGASRPLLAPASLPFAPPDDPIEDTEKPLHLHHHQQLPPRSPTASEHDLDPDAKPRPKTLAALLLDSIRIFVPFLLLSITYGTWFVTQKLFNDEYRTNMFGYTSIDQVWAPVYMWIFLLVVDFTPFRATLHSAEDQKESFFEAAKNSFQIMFCQRWGRGFFTLFSYRFLTNARAIAYFYMGVTYDLTAVYLELTLVRVILSWIMAVFMCGLKPSFIGLTTAERNTVFAPGNIALKVAGTAFVLAAIFILNDAQN